MAKFALIKDLCIESDRWGEKSSTKLSKKQQTFLDKLRSVVSNAAKNPHDEDKAQKAAAISTVLEYLPDCPVLAIFFAEQFKFTEDVIQDIRKLFEFHRKFI